jgi:hypothetical protein
MTQKKQGIADAHHISLAEESLAYAMTVHERPVGTLVLNSGGRTPGGLKDRRVEPRDRWVGR